MHRRPSDGGNIAWIGWAAMHVKDFDALRGWRCMMLQLFPAKCHRVRSVENTVSATYQMLAAFNGLSDQATWNLVEGTSGILCTERCLRADHIVRAARSIYPDTVRIFASTV